MNRVSLYASVFLIAMAVLFDELMGFNEETGGWRHWIEMRKLSRARWRAGCDRAAHREEGWYPSRR
jgi:hypothetical protein